MMCVYSPGSFVQLAHAAFGIANTLWFESDRRITKPVTELQGNITFPMQSKSFPMRLALVIPIHARGNFLSFT
jgi:hypothetical protein